MVAIWYTRIDVDGNVVHQYGSQGVRSVFEVTNNFAVKGEDKAGQSSNVCDRVGDDAIDVDGLSNECHCNGGSMKIGVVSGVVPASVVHLGDIDHCSESVRILGVDIAGVARGAVGPLVRRGICRQGTRNDVAILIVYRTIDKDGGRCEHWQDTARG